MAQRAMATTNLVAMGRWPMRGEILISINVSSPLSLPWRSALELQDILRRPDRRRVVHPPLGGAPLAPPGPGSRLRAGHPRADHQPPRPRALGLLRLLRRQAHPGARERGALLPQEPPQG